MQLAITDLPHFNAVAFVGLFSWHFFGRLLYGRMQRWTGAGTGGKAGAGARRSVVLRFIASCPSSEMKIFMDLILAPFKHLYDGM